MSVRPETFSRILQQSSRKNLVAVQGETVEMLDVKALQRKWALGD
ncbi:hypothetical protein [Methylovulum sp.]